MPRQRDDIDEGPTGRMVELFEVLEETLQGVEERGEELTGCNMVLDMVREHIGPALMEEMQAAGPSGTAAWHIPHLASVVVERAGMPRRGAAAKAYQPLRAANKRLEEALEAPPTPVEPGPEDEIEGLEELERLVQRLPEAVSDQVLKWLPDAVAQAVVAALDPGGGGDGGGGGGGGVPVPPVPFPTLADLAAASPSDYIALPSARIAFLEGALALLVKVRVVPPELVPPVTGVVVGVLDYADPRNPLTISELHKMTALKQRIAPFLQQPAQRGGR